MNPVLSQTPLRPVASKPDYLRANQTVGSWLLTTDHKRIGILYMISITLLFFVGAIAAALLRLSWPRRRAICSPRRPTTNFSPCTA